MENKDASSMTMNTSNPQQNANMSTMSNMNFNLPSSNSSSNKMFLLVIIIIAILAVVAVAGGYLWYTSNQGVQPGAPAPTSQTQQPAAKTDLEQELDQLQIEDISRDFAEVDREMQNL